MEERFPKNYPAHMKRMEELPAQALRLFEATAARSALLRAEPPRYIILAATPAYLEAAGSEHDQLIGRDLFDFFPSNPGDAADNGAALLRASLDRVVTTGAAQDLSALRYDMADADGHFQERYWNVANRPFSTDSDIPYIIHTVEEVTHQVLGRRHAAAIPNLAHAYELFMQAPVSVVMLTGEDLIVDMANVPALEQWRKDRSIIGKPLRDVLPHLADHEYGHALLNVLHTGQPLEFKEAPLTVARDGVEETCYFNFIYKPYFTGDDPRPSGVLAIGIEVTGEVRARQALAESRQRLELAVEIAGLGDYNVDIRTGTATFSRQLMDWYGLPTQTETLEAILERIHPDDRAAASQAYDGATIIAGYHDLTYRVTDAHGTIRHMRSIGQSRFEDGQPVAISGIIQDVTSQVIVRQRIEQSSARFRAIVEQAPVATCFFLGPDFIIEVVNEPMLAFWGKDASVIGKPLIEAVPELEGQPFIDLLKRVYETGETYVGSAVAAELPVDGVLGTYYFDFTYKPLFDENGNVYGIADMATNVTEQVYARRRIEEVVTERTGQLAEANEALQHMNRELQRSNQHLEEFAHAASHDMKEPIRKIQVFTGRLKSQLEEQLSPSNQDLLARIEKASERMGLLVDDLLRYSHVSQRPLEMEPIDLNQKINRVLEDLELHIQEKGATVEVGALPTVRGYRRQLQQLFQNLITNALKYNRAGVAPRISITSSQVKEGGKSYHRIDVADNGIGFEEQYKEKIFQMFTRLHGKHEYGGTGVGLSIVKKVVENHEGFIRVSSTVGEGSTFTVYFPHKEGQE